MRNFHNKIALSLYTKRFSLELWSFTELVINPLWKSANDKQKVLMFTNTSAF